MVGLTRRTPSLAWGAHTEYYSFSANTNHPTSTINITISIKHTLSLNDDLVSSSQNPLFILPFSPPSIFTPPYSQKKLSGRQTYVNTTLYSFLRCY